MPTEETSIPTLQTKNSNEHENIQVETSTEKEDYIDRLNKRIDELEARDRARGTIEEKKEVQPEKQDECPKPRHRWFNGIFG